jgi:hypothetical protein
MIHGTITFGLVSVAWLKFVFNTRQAKLQILGLQALADVYMQYRIAGNFRGV